MQSSDNVKRVVHSRLRGPLGSSFEAHTGFTLGLDVNSKSIGVSVDRAVLGVEKDERIVNSGGHEKPRVRET